MVFFLCLFLPLLLLLKKKGNSPNLPPGPKPLPLIGNLHQLGGGDLLHRSAADLSKEHGPVIRLRLGQVPSIVISSPDLAREVLKVQDFNFLDRAPQQVALDTYTGGGGDHHRHWRRIFALELLSPEKLQQFDSLRQDETDRLIRHVAIVAGTENPVDLTELVLYLVNTFAFKIAFGYETDKEERYGKRSRVHEVVEECNGLMRTTFAEDLFPGFGGWLIDCVTGQRMRLEKNAKELDEFFQKVVDEHMAVDDRVGEGCCREEDFVDVMIRLWKAGNTDLGVEIIKGMLADMLVAGTYTTAATIIWTMTELARHPTAMKKAQEEVRNLIGPEKGKVEQTDLSHLHYLKSVVNESMRLHSKLLVPRQAIQDCKIGEYDIAAKTVVYVNSWALGRDPELWEKPEEFIPERFVETSEHFRGNDFHQFLPFGKGRRPVGPETSFGISGVELVLASLLYGFNWELPAGMKEEDVDVGESTGSVTHKKAPLCLVARNNRK